VQTLYEILGALPDDDADDLRTAFRKAVKTSHPDNNPDDPDAPERFRRIVRANSILGDEQQRAVYDSMLGEAEQQPVLNSNARYPIPGVVGCMAIAFVSIGAFLLFERILTVSVVAAKVQNISARVSALTAAMPTLSFDTVGLAAKRNKPEKTSVSNEMEVANAVTQTTAQGAAAAANNAGAIPATFATVMKDAKYYRQQGSLAYRSGDLPLALIDFDLAINLDPNFADTYIDRAIVLRRMGDMKRALADVAQAKRIDELKPE
jgi:curved DNA-binding protein CbpA